MNRDEYLRGVQKMMRDAWIRQQAATATAEARFYAGRVRQAYWRGVRPGPGWRMPAQATGNQERED